MKTTRQTKQKEKKQYYLKTKQKHKNNPRNMGIRPIVGSGQTAMGRAAAAMRYVIFWTVMMGVTGGQELLTTRNHDNLNAAEIRFDSRALHWMDFSKPEPSQQVRNIYSFNEDMIFIQVTVNKFFSSLNTIGEIISYFTRWERK